MLPAASVLGSLVYFPSREIAHTPAAAGLVFRDLAFTTDDGIQLRGGGSRRPRRTVSARSCSATATPETSATDSSKRSS